MRIPLADAVALGLELLRSVRFTRKGRENRRLAVLRLIPLFESAASQWRDGASEALEQAALNDERLREFRLTLDAIYRTLKQLKGEP